MAPESPQKIANAASAIHAELVKRRWAKIRPANTNTFFTHWRGRIETTIARSIVTLASTGRRGPPSPPPRNGRDRACPCERAPRRVTPQRRDALSSLLGALRGG